MSKWSTDERTAPLQAGGIGTFELSLPRREAERDGALRARLKELAAKCMRFGYRRLTAMLVREGMFANHKWVYRLYRDELLAMRIRQRSGCAGLAR